MRADISFGNYSEAYSGLVSIIMPAYNAAETIGYSIRSVLAQTYSNFELIVINDGSSDLTVSKVNSFKDKRIRLISQKNQGVSVARNNGISLARGEFIAFLDSDDAWHSNKLSVQLTILRERLDVDFVFSSFYTFNHHGISNMPAYSDCFSSVLPHSETILTIDFIATLTVLLRKSALVELGPDCFDPTLSGTEDWDLWIRLLQKVNIYYIQECLAYYRSSSVGLSGNFRFHHNEELKVLLKHDALFGLYPLRVKTFAYIFWRLKAVQHCLALSDYMALTAEIQPIFANYSFGLIASSVVYFFRSSLLQFMAKKVLFWILLMLGLTSKYKKLPFSLVV